MIRVIVATCFVVFIGLCTASLAYYAAKVSHSVQAEAKDWKVQYLRQWERAFGEPQYAAASRPKSKHEPRQVQLSRPEHGGRIARNLVFTNALLRASRRVTGRFRLARQKISYQIALHFATRRGHIYSGSHRIARMAFPRAELSPRPSACKDR